MKVKDIMKKVIGVFFEIEEPIKTRAKVPFADNPNVDYWFDFLQYEFIRSDVCKECDHRYSTYDSRDNYYEWCTYPAKGKCAHEKEWRDCVLKKIKKCIEDRFLQELEE